MKRYLILFLALVLVLGCLAGCRRKDNTVSKDPDGMIGTTERPTLPSTTSAPTESSTRQTEATQRTEPSVTQDQESGSTESMPNESESTHDNAVGRARRTRPLYR